MGAPSFSSLGETVLGAVVTIALTGVPGFVAGVLGIIDKEFLRGLSCFNLTCLTPCLIFSTFGGRLTYERLGKVGPLVVWSVAQLCAGRAVSRGLVYFDARLWRPHGASWPSRGPAFTVLGQLAVTFQNIGAFCLPMLQTLCQTDGIFPGHDKHCFDDGALMVFGYHLPWDLAMWTQGYASMLALGGVPEPKHGCTDSAAEGPSITAKSKASSRLRDLAAAADHFINPIFAAMLLGLVVGLIPAFRELFFGPRAPLGPVGIAAQRVGGIVPIVGLQILTCTLGLAARQLWDEHRASAKAKDGAAPTCHASWIATVLFGKLFLMPALSFCAFTVAYRLQLQPGRLDVDLTEDAVAEPAVSGLALPQLRYAAVGQLSRMLWPDDRLLRTVVVLQWSAPSCLGLIVLCHRVGLDDALVRAMAMLYLVMYALTAVSTTIWVTAGLLLF